MAYKLVVPKKVQKELDKIDFRYQIKINNIFRILEDNPFIGKKLEGEYAGYYTYRIWPYRIIYSIRKRELVVLVLHIAHRQGVYK